MARPDKTRISYVCQQCGKESPKWVGRCPECQAWNTMVETTLTRPATPRVSVRGEPARRLSRIELKNTDRLPLPLSELNRVLGGGLVAGSVALISGEPGIGKSTLLLQIADMISTVRGSAVYVSQRRPNSRSNSVPSASASRGKSFPSVRDRPGRGNHELDN